MRDKHRLINFYNVLCSHHEDNFPDWRFGQLIENFKNWLYISHDIGDIFYLEESDFLEYFCEFIREITDELSDEAKEC